MLSVAAPLATLGTSGFGSNAQVDEGFGARRQVLGNSGVEHQRLREPSVITLVITKVVRSNEDHVLLLAGSDLASRHGAM